MQVMIAEESVFVEKKKKETDELIVIVGQESVVAEEEGAKAAIEEAEVAEIAKGVQEFQESANRDLAAAEPAIKKAEAALGGLNKAALGELKGLASPPAAVLNVTAAVTFMLQPKGTPIKKIGHRLGRRQEADGRPGQVPRDAAELRQGQLRPRLPPAKVRCGSTRARFTLPDGRTVTQGFEGTEENPEFNFKYMSGKSSAAAGLCDWIVNICIYHDIYLDVAPKRAKLAAAEAELAAANKKLAGVRAHVAALDAKMAELNEQLEDGDQREERAHRQRREDAEARQPRQPPAQRPRRRGRALAERGRSLDEKTRLLVGDVMLSSSFVAYIAPFSRAFRDELVNEKWTPDVIARAIPLTEGFDPMDDADRRVQDRRLERRGLPADPLSTQNASIITQVRALPADHRPAAAGGRLDPRREEPNGLISVVPGAKGWLDKVIRALEEGLPLLLENMKETIEAILDNVVARAYVKKGSSCRSTSATARPTWRSRRTRRSTDGDPALPPLHAVAPAQPALYPRGAGADDPRQLHRHREGPRGPAPLDGRRPRAARPAAGAEGPRRDAERLHDQAQGARRQPALPARDGRGRHPRQRGADCHARGDQGDRHRDQRQAGRSPPRRRSRSARPSSRTGRTPTAARSSTS